jgi:hypothetical protein
MDPLTSAALITSGATLVSGLIGDRGIASQNAANRDIAREQMAFQERMSNTAHQREVADLKKAGLNPILSVNRTGASSPVGATAVMQNQMANRSSSVKQAVTDALSTKLLKSQIENVQTDTKVKDMEYVVKDAQAALLGSQTSATNLNNRLTAIDVNFWENAEFARWAKQLGVDPKFLKDLLKQATGGRKK